MAKLNRLKAVLAEQDKTSKWLADFTIEACNGIPIHYDNWYEHVAVDLTEEQFERYCVTLKYWRTTDEWNNWNTDNGEDFFIKRDLPDIYEMVMKKVI